MSGTLFPGHGGSSSNPFGSFSMGASQPSGTIGGITEEDENDTLFSPTNASFGNHGQSTFGGGDGSFGRPPSSFKPTPAEGFPNNYLMGRRVSVSAESLTPNQGGEIAKHDKSDEENAIIQKALHDHPLFSKLEEDQIIQLMGAMVEKDVPAKDVKVISQGDQGDYYYVIAKGSFDVYIHPSGTVQPGGFDGLGTKVANIQKGGSFGELALLYGHPRNATVISAEPNCKVFQIDRITFRRIIMNNSFARRRMYEDFLQSVPLLKSLDDGERAKIADALQTEKYPAGATIIREGDKGEAFYLLESGTAQVYKSGNSDVLKIYGKGDYFGELALLNDAPRAASVVCTSECRVARLSQEGFQRLLGPVEAILRRTRYDDDEVDPLSKQ